MMCSSANCSLLKENMIGLFESKTFLRCLFFLLLIFASIIFVMYQNSGFLFRHSSDHHEKCYALVLDCGSSGSRIFLYQWIEPETLTDDLLDIKPMVDLAGVPLSKKISPGLSSYSSRPMEAAEALIPLLDFAAYYVPKKMHSKTLLYIMATAGMRLLNSTTQEAILKDLRRDIPKLHSFYFPPANTKIISGKEEGLYAWIAVNYILKRFDHSEDESSVLNGAGFISTEHRDTGGELIQHRRLRTVGIVDMGGASVQIAYELPNEIHKEDGLDSSLMCNISLGCKDTDINHRYRVYVKSFLSFGANEAMKRYRKLILKEKELSLIREYKKTRRMERVKSLMSVGNERVNLFGENFRNKTAGNGNLEKTRGNDAPSILINASHNDTSVEDNFFLAANSSELHRAMGNEITPDKYAVVLQKRDISFPLQYRLRRGISDIEMPRESLTSVDVPCFPKGLKEYVEGISYVGTGNWTSCVHSLRPLLLQSPCKSFSCFMDGVPQAAIDYKRDEFYGFSEFWFTSESVLHLGGLYNRSRFYAESQNFCESNWNTLQQRFRKNLYPDADDERIRVQCFKAAWLLTVLHEGFHFPASYNLLTSALKLSPGSMETPQELQWTLGALLYHTRFLYKRNLVHIKAMHSSVFFSSSFVTFVLFICVSFFVMIALYFCLRLIWKLYIHGRSTGIISNNAQRYISLKMENSSFGFGRSRSDPLLRNSSNSSLYTFSPV